MGIRENVILGKCDFGKLGLRENGILGKWEFLADKSTVLFHSQSTIYKFFRPKIYQQIYKIYGKNKQTSTF